MLKFALINPPYLDEESFEKRLAPMGICYIAAYLESKNIECDVFDFSSSNLNNETLIEKYNLIQYDAIAFSTYTCFFRDTVRFSEAIKQKNPKVTIIMGGHHVTLAPKEVLSDFPIVNFVSIGYGEPSMYELLLSMSGKMRLEDIKGIGYRNGKDIVINECDVQDLNLDLIPFPRRKIITDYGNHFPNYVEGKKIINFVSSRGCVYNCHFCVNTKNLKWLPRSTENVIEEVKSLYALEAFDHIFFTDCNFLIDPKRSLKILELIHEFNPSITVNFHARCDQIVKHEDVIKRIGKLGCTFINVGVESDSVALLNRFNKQIEPIVNQQAIEILREADIQPNVYMIMFEALVTLDDIHASFQFLKKNKLMNFVGVHNIYNSLIPFYGTPYWKNYNEFYSDAIHGISKTYFQDKRVEQFYAVIRQLRKEFEMEIAQQVSTFMRLQVSQPACINENLFQNYILIQHFQYLAFETLLHFYREKEEGISYEALKKNPLVSDYIKVIEENKMLLSKEKLKNG